jgi:hypothetical protein
MSVETALEQMLQMLHRRALRLAALPEDERDPQYDLIRLYCCGAAERIGQSPDKAAETANNMVEFTRAMVGIIERGQLAQVTEEGDVAGDVARASGAPAAGESRHGGDLDHPVRRDQMQELGPTASSPYVGDLLRAASSVGSSDPLSAPSLSMASGPPGKMAGWLNSLRAPR